MILKILVVVIVIAVALFSTKGLLQERKRKIDKRAKTLGMGSIFGTDKSK